MNWLHYLLLVNIYLVLFYGFYALLLRKETFFQLNRIYLVSASLLSFIIPVIQSDWVKNLFITEEVHYSIYGQAATVNFYELHPVQSSPITVGEVLLALYMAGIAFLTIRLVIQLVKVNKLLKTPEPSTAYAFFNKINLGENALDQEAVLAHEQVHARQLHSVDVLLIETVMIINWFNPIVYLYRFAIKHIHEYIADQQVIKIGADKAEYAMLLVSQTFSVPQHGLVSAFAGSLLKKRIQMLQKDRSKRIVLFKYIMSAPLFGLMLILSSATIDDNKAVNMIQHHANALFDESAKSVISDIVSPIDNDEIDDHSEITPQTTQDEKVYDKVDQVPQYPGGMDAFERFLTENMKYPAKARQKNIHGKVYVQFVIEPDGSLTHVKAMRGPSADLNAEAVRVIKHSRKWTPGMVKGKKVRTSFIVPVNFTLDIKEVVLTAPTPAIKEEAPQNPNKVYDAVEKEPDFPGGQDAFNRFLAGVIRFPAVDKENNVTGKSYVSFIVEPDGSLSNVKAVRGPSETEKAEAVRGVSLSPKWNPGIQNGKAVRVSYTVPVNFTLNAGGPKIVTNFIPNAAGVYEAVQKEPEFPGGITAFNQFLSKNVKYPAVDRDNNVTGKVYVSFIVEKDGSLSEVRALRGPSETTMAEAVRAITLSPKWKPGLQNGAPVRASYTVPVNYILSDDKDDVANLSSESVQIKWLRANFGTRLIALRTENNKIIMGPGTSGKSALMVLNGKEITDLSQINPNNIASYDVLNGDAAVKKYGDKAKNGVIIITLK